MKNELKQLKEFQQALADYHISQDSLLTLRQTHLVLLVAPTSAGRNTLIKQLIKTGEYAFIISDTTRKPRVNDGVMEQNGVEYWFRSEEEVLRDINDGNYLEAEIIHNQQVSGMPIRELQKAHEANKIAITDIDLGGILNILSVKPDTVAVLLLPPSFEEWQRRITHRGPMDPSELKRRLKTARTIYAAALESNHFTFVTNDTVEHATEQVHHLAKLGSPLPEEQEAGRRLAEQLYIETQAYLKSL
jgi:guanylate kinase